MAASSVSLSCLRENEFRRSLECQYGLLDHLLKNGCITGEAFKDLKQRHCTERERNSGLIRRINESNLKKFEQGLEETNQRHLANFIRRNGKRGPPDEEWPLSLTVVKSIQKCLVDFVTDIETVSLVNHLVSKECISKEHLESIQSKDTLSNKNRELLDIMERRSIQQLEKFKLCLTLSDHPSNLLDKLTQEIDNLTLAGDFDDASVLEFQHQENADYVKYITSPDTKGRIIKHDNIVRGVTVVDGEIFVARDGQSHINVYDSQSLQESRVINVPDMRSTWGLAGCPFNRALYISDQKLESVHKVNLTNDIITSWDMRADHWPWGISLTAQHNILVILQSSGNVIENILAEYTNEGQLVREIRLDASIQQPRDVVQLSSDQFIVSHGGGFLNVHRVCVVNHKGKIIDSYGNILDGFSRLYWPTSLAIDTCKNILFVADCDNNRVLLLDTDLTCLGLVHASRCLKGSFRIFFDSSTDRLFVGEEKGGRVLVISPPQ